MQWRKASFSNSKGNCVEIAVAPCTCGSGFDIDCEQHGMDIGEADCGC